MILRLRIRNSDCFYYSKLLKLFMKQYNIFQRYKCTVEALRLPPNEHMHTPDMSGKERKLNNIKFSIKSTKDIKWVGDISRKKEYEKQAADSEKYCRY